jgi:hypothetical protein
MLTKRLESVLSLLLIATSAVSSPAEAAVTFYNSLAGWQLNSSTTTVLDLNSVTSGYYGSPGSIDLGPMSVTTNGPLFVQNTNLWGQGSFLSPQQLTGATVTFSFDSPVTAFAFDYAAGASLTVTVGGQSTTLPGGTYPPYLMSFFGVTSDTPFSTLSFTMSGNGADLDNLRPGTFTPAALPEPASWAMMLFGFGLIGLVIRRAKPRNANRSQVGAVA